MELKHLKTLTTLNEATSGHGFFQEAKQYTDSGEFTDEFYDLFTQVTKMKKVMKNPKWVEYMRTTDRNFSASTEASARTAIKAVTELEDALTDIDRELDHVNGGDGE